MFYRESRIAHGDVFDLGVLTSSRLSKDFGTRKRIKMRQNKKFFISISSIIAEIICSRSLKKSIGRRSLRIEPCELEASNVFCLTIYEMQGSLFKATPVSRYLVNPEMESQLQKDMDGGITLFIQNESPDKRRVSNWLPAPKGIFV